jgi:hypothetical protein
VRSSLRNFGLLLASAATAGGMAVALPSVAHASAGCAQGEQSHFDQVSGDLKKTNPLDLNRPGYKVTYTWCTAGGDVVGFVVGNVVQDNGVKLDIRPTRPLEWGPEYPIFVHVTGNNTEVDDWEITLKGDGTIDKPSKAS